MKRYMMVFLILASTVAVGGWSLATVPQLINYQGILTDDQGVPITGTHDLTFAIYENDLPSATALWSETHSGVQVDKGLFNVILGGVTAIPPTLFEQDERWIGISVDGDTEMAPRMQFTSVPWAFQSAAADSAGKVVWSNISSMPAGFADGVDDVGGAGDGHSLDAADGSPVDVVYVDNDGNVGVGTTSPGSKLEVRYPNMSQSSPAIAIDNPLASLAHDVLDFQFGGTAQARIRKTWRGDFYIGTVDNYAVRLRTNDADRMIVSRDGDVGIGTTSPSEKLDVAGTAEVDGFRMRPGANAGHVLTSDANGIGTWQAAGGIGGSGNAGLIARFSGPSTITNSMIHYANSVCGGGIGIGAYPVESKLLVLDDMQCLPDPPQATYLARFQTGLPAIDQAYITRDGDAYFRGEMDIDVLHIRGGADIAEPFPMANDEAIPEGALMVIDEETPGALKMSTQPYDRRVAGVVSGAGGVKPGLTLNQQGVFDGKNVALGGRVYVNATASNGPIKPGDLLTSSTIPGHAMRVTDFDRSNGAVIGKAMGSLDKGAGLVLVLVSLQ